MNEIPEVFQGPIWKRKTEHWTQTFHYFVKGFYYVNVTVVFLKKLTVPILQCNLYDTTYSSSNKISIKIQESEEKRKFLVVFQDLEDNDF